MSDSGLSSREAVRAAAIRGNLTRGKRRRDRYAADPKFCAHCNQQLDYINRKNRFCDHSCAASANNLGVTRHSKYVKKPCAMCETITKNPKFCSSICFRKSTKQRSEQGPMANGCFSTASAAKRYLLRVHGNVCAVCGLSEWNDKPISLCIDHVDGHHENHNVNNVRLICNNCDAQPDTYKGKNRGNGRHSRMERYHKGLSY